MGGMTTRFFKVIVWMAIGEKRRGYRFSAILFSLPSEISGWGFPQRSCERRIMQFPCLDEGFEQSLQTFADIVSLPQILRHLTPPLMIYVRFVLRRTIQSAPMSFNYHLPIQNTDANPAPLFVEVLQLFEGKKWPHKGHKTLFKASYRHLLETPSRDFLQKVRG